MKETIRQLIKKHEGYSDKLYKCSAGKLTIGYGHNIEENGISQKVADNILTEDIGVAEGVVRKYVFDYNFLTYERQAALVDMAFNLGENRFSKFKKMLIAVNQENWKKAAEELVDSEYYVQVGKRAEENRLLLLG